VRAYDPAGQGAFYGPRAVTISADGEVYVTDTGNKRVQVFDTEGTYLWEFGGAGDGLTQMNEPVGVGLNVTLGADVGEVFVADTWNQRVQVFTLEGGFLRYWDVPVWGIGGDHPEEKPFLAVTEDAVYVSDPVHQRILAFNSGGTFLWALKDVTGLAFPQGVAVSGDTLYVSDAHAGQVVAYQLP
jgi:sugar lactone lactonase YvrE